MYLTKLRTILHSNYFLFIFILIVLWLTLVRNQLGIHSAYTLEEHQLTGVVKKIKTSKNYSILEVVAKEKVQVIIYKRVSLKIGDTVSIEGTLKRPEKNRMEHLFNYRNYLKSQRIFWMMEAKSIQVIEHSNNWLDITKNFLKQELENRKEKAYYKTFILGDQSDLTDTYKRRVRKLGVSHLFALSGMHLSIFSLCFIKLLSYFKFSEKKKSFILCGILLCYVLITLQSPSILRAFFYLLLCTINKQYHLKYTSFQLFVYLCGGFLLINPFIIYSTSFLYSFVVSFFLVYFKRFIQQKHTVFRLSMVAASASMPITLLTSFEFNLCSLFLNILLSPFISMIIFPLCILSFIFPVIEPIFSFSLFIMDKVFVFIETYFTWMISFRALPIAIYVLYLLFVFICFEALQRKNRMYCYLLLTLFVCHHFLPYIDSKTKVVFLDVGQGDSSLISLAHHQGNILIDTGGSFNHKCCYNEIIPYLKSQGIVSLDYLILTHGDHDHAGEATCLVENFKVDKVIFNNDAYNDLEQELLKLLKKNNIKYYNGLEELNIGKYKLQFLNTKTYDNENDNSNVIYFNYNNYKFLFMGDASVDREKDILQKYNLKNIDFLKVGHHGSNTSSSKEFINEINSNISIISVGKNNRYGHPKETVLDTLSNSRIYRTDKDGSIEIRLNKNGYKIKTCPP